ncbi:MAG: ATP-dependent sacrificial sulfur transferase LarE [Planctomycetes bacterium]|nr:ATP-dependent sacrificial sulfur transferase LarE [Planctomycetota bacterium]
MPEDERMQKLKAILRDLGSVLVAFSGGVDSSLLAKVAHDVLGDRMWAVTATSPTCPAFEREDAEAFCRKYGIPHRVVETQELALEGFRANPPERCYYCKKERFSRLVEMAEGLGLRHVVDGSNVDDTGDFRPGMRAIDELGVYSPLKEAGLWKQDVRDLSKGLGLPTWDRPAYACLATRVPYGIPLTPAVLSMVERAEEALRVHGFRQFRVRHHESIARIELPPGDFDRFMAPAVRGDVVARLKEIGYLYVTLDLQGYRMGSMNEPLTEDDRT